MTQELPSTPGRPRQRVRYYAAQSLDGYTAEADPTLAWLLEHDRRTAPADPSAGAVPLGGEIERFMAAIGAVVVGARTDEHVLGEGVAWPYPGRPTWVLSHRDLPVPPGADVRVGPLTAVEATRAALAAAGGREVWVLGGGPVAQDLAEAGPLDTVEVTVVPSSSGAGCRCSAAGWWSRSSDRARPRPRGARQVQPLTTP